MKVTLKEGNKTSNKLEIQKASLKTQFTVPKIAFSSDGNCPIINCNVPEPSVYNGRNMIELKFEDPDIFNLDSFNTPNSIPVTPPLVTEVIVTQAMINGFSDDKIFPLVKQYAGLLRLIQKGNSNDPTYEIVSNQDISKELKNLHPKEVYTAMLANKSLMIYRTMFGTLSYQYLQPQGQIILPSADIVTPGTVEGVPGSFTFESPGNNAEVEGPYPSYKILLTGTDVVDDPGYLPDIRVQIDDGPVLMANYKEIEETSSRADFKWFIEYPITSPGDKIIKLTAKNVTTPPISLTAQIKATYNGQGSIDKRPRLLLLESYRLESHLGQYGAGRILNTFTLLPGEKTTISIRTYTRTETEAKRASSIFDTVTEESTKDFENSMMNEQSDKSNYQESFGYEISARAQASWGWGSAGISASVRGSTNSA